MIEIELRECNSYKSFYKKGTNILHREDGPAFVFVDGTKYWYLYIKQIQVSSNEEFLRLVKLKAFW